MDIKRISRGEMPPKNKYILIFLHNRPWNDDDDPSGVRWDVAKCEYGISKEERYRLSISKNLDDQRRAKLFYSCDEDGNNLRPYSFKQFGPSEYYGQEVDIWCELPIVEKENEETCNHDFTDKDCKCYVKDNVKYLLQTYSCGFCGKIVHTEKILKSDIKE